ncbi:hypothetical protein B0H11DRAFT_2134844 [Mycena galericulata]|nr:hypothetical protein B0H11DRAFT_2134844 [Mycena galericulata]
MPYPELEGSRPWSLGWLSDAFDYLFGTVSFLQDHEFEPRPCRYQLDYFTCSNIPSTKLPRDLESEILCLNPSDSETKLQECPILCSCFYLSSQCRNHPCIQSRYVFVSTLTGPMAQRQVSPFNFRIDCIISKSAQQIETLKAVKNTGKDIEKRSVHCDNPGTQGTIRTQNAEHKFAFNHGRRDSAGRCVAASDSILVSSSRASQRASRTCSAGYEFVPAGRVQLGARSVRVWRAAAWALARQTHG